MKNPSNTKIGPEQPTQTKDTSALKTKYIELPEVYWIGIDGYCFRALERKRKRKELLRDTT